MISNFVILIVSLVSGQNLVSKQENEAEEENEGRFDSPRPHLDWWEHVSSVTKQHGLQRVRRPAQGWFSWTSVTVILELPRPPQLRPRHPRPPLVIIVSSCPRQPTTQWNQNQIIEILSGLSQFGFKWIQKQKETIPWYISENNKDQRSKAPLLQQKKPCDKKENCTKMLQAGKFTSSTCRKQNLYNRTSLHFSITQRYWYKEGREGGGREDPASSIFWLSRSQSQSWEQALSRGHGRIW